MEKNYETPIIEMLSVTPMVSLMQNNSPINPGGDVPPSGDGGDD